MEKRRILPRPIQAVLQKFYTTFLLGIILLTDCLAHGQVNVEPNTALLNEGDRTELLCRYERPITYCRMEIAGETKVYNLSPEWDATPGFTYYGSGLQSGQCGVTIQRVKAINNGQVKCTLGVQGEEVYGIINLVVAMRPKQPVIELITKPDREGYFHEGHNFEARCVVKDGRPAANITWMLDNEPADKRLGQLEVLASAQEVGPELSTTIQAIQWRITAEDNGRKLICRSHHQTDRENVPPQETVVPLYVRYAPIHLPETVVYGLYLDQTVKVNITIRANPLPIVEWIIDGHLVRQGEQNGRFSAYEPEYLGQDFYNVTLVIAGLSLEDTNRIYHLRATNSLGTTDYNVRISSSATPPVTGLEVGAIVGIVVAVAFLIVVVLLTLFARATGRWCFAGKSVKMSPNETSDTESADVKATASTTTTLTTATMVIGSDVSPPLSSALTSASASAVASSSNPVNLSNINDDGNNGNGGRQNNNSNNSNTGNNKNNNNNNNNNSNNKNNNKRRLVKKVATTAVTTVTSAATAATAATKRLPNTLTTLFKRINERDQQPLSKRKDATELGEGNLGAISTTSSINGSTIDATTATNIDVNVVETVNRNSNSVITPNATLNEIQKQQQQQQQQHKDDDIAGSTKAIEINDNKVKEDKQLVYAELVLKPSDNNEIPTTTMPPKSSTEYAEIVYVQKPN